MCCLCSLSCTKQTVLSGHIVLEPGNYTIRGAEGKPEEGAKVVGDQLDEKDPGTPAGHSQCSKRKRSRCEETYIILIVRENRASVHGTPCTRAPTPDMQSAWEATNAASKVQQELSNTGLLSGLEFPRSWWNAGDTADVAPGHYRSREEGGIPQASFWLANLNSIRIFTAVDLHNHVKSTLKTTRGCASASVSLGRVI